MAYALLAEVAASVTDLKKDPMGTYRESNGDPMVILNRNEPAFYILSPERYEELLDLLDDAALARKIKERRGGRTVKVDINDLIAEAERR
ncbi:plasmid stabilization protein [Pseudomonas cichorii]|nr:type II toxin-antitoxin system Phd/YefM family antitoxin [Pseudomonas cichorii]GFM72952.1 plasmid stabilization protein [Pseudomonas cichorii]